MIHEFGGVDLEIDLGKAVNHYRRTTYLLGDADLTTLLYLARALFKQGPLVYEAAFRYIKVASAAGHIPEVDLAFGRYYEVAAIDYDKAWRFYLKAALKGRFAGSAGVASVLRRTGHPICARMVDAIRIITGPFVFLLVGRKGISSFDGY